MEAGSLPQTSGDGRGVSAGGEERRASILAKGVLAGWLAGWLAGLREGGRGSGTAFRLEEDRSNNR